MELTDLKVKEFIDVLASDAPAPGGGSASALEGAVGSALMSMVCALTVGKKKYADHWELAEQTGAKAQALKQEYLEVLELDTEAFNGVSRVFQMPKDTDEQKAARKAAMQAALKECTNTPFRMMQLADTALSLLSELNGKTNASAASDYGCGALALKSAAQGAWLNVLINISGLNDAEFASKYQSEGAALLKSIEEKADRLYADVIKSITG